MQTLRQWFDEESSTFTYVLICPQTRDTVIIDSVAGQLGQYLELIAQERLQLKWVLETHAHADHVTAAGALALHTGAVAATPAGCRVTPAPLQLEDGQGICFGAGETIRVIHTPGHTPGSTCYLWRDKLFSGDTLLIDGCGRTDFPDGNAGTLYDSITQKLFVLPDATVLYPGHDYRGRRSSTIGRERTANDRLATRSRDEFVALMNGLDLPLPKLIDVAVTANRRLGLPASET
jgi:sulfur dioxygenase